jgi:hypothetical protein
MVHLRIIEDAVDSYLCGVYDDEIEFFDEREHCRAAEFIFETEGTFSFEYHWELAFPNIDITVGDVRRALLENFQRRYKQWRKHASNNGNGRRERSPCSGDHGQHPGDNQISPTGKWIESILFGPGPQGGNGAGQRPIHK